MSWDYSEKDIVLYALSLGCKWDETSSVYYGHQSLEPLPTFGVLALHQNAALDSVDFSKIVPNFNPVRFQLCLSICLNLEVQI